MVQLGKVKINAYNFTDVILAFSYTKFFNISGIAEDMSTDVSRWSSQPGGKPLSLNKFRLACTSGGFDYYWKTVGI